MKPLALTIFFAFYLSMQSVYSIQIISKSKLQKCEKASDSNQQLNCTNKIVIDLAVPSESVRNLFRYIYMRTYSSPDVIFEFLLFLAIGAERKWGFNGGGDSRSGRGCDEHANPSVSASDYCPKISCLCFVWIDIHKSMLGFALVFEIVNQSYSKSNALKETKLFIQDVAYKPEELYVKTRKCKRNAGSNVVRICERQVLFIDGINILLWVMLHQIVLKTTNCFLIFFSLKFLFFPCCI